MAELFGVMKQLHQERARAARELEHLDEAIRVVGTLVGRNGAGPRVVKRVRAISAAGRKRIAAAQRARWAKWKAKHVKKAA